MNKEARAEWVKDLRSNQYRQGFGRLKSHDGSYCCLGVACETYKRLTGRGEWRKNDEHDDSFSVDNPSPDRIIDYDYLSLPLTVAQYFGFDDQNPTLLQGDKVTPTNCVSINDALRANFHVIADLIERTYLKD